MTEWLSWLIDALTWPLQLTLSWLAGLLYGLVVLVVNFCWPYMPHYRCISSNPMLIIGEVAGDSMFFVAYMIIPWKLAALVLRFKPLIDPLTGWTIDGFRRFILLCGSNHLMHVVTMFVGIYGPATVLTVIGGYYSLRFANRFADLVNIILSNDDVGEAVSDLLHRINIAVQRRVAS